ncbi:hypothetical protein GWF38_03675 [Campylobacter upsaliensis]|nr:hypothetical protein [Campylobacter upsaliensis]
MKHDFYEFLEIQALLFVCTFIFALMHCTFLTLIGCALSFILDRGSCSEKNKGKNR